MPGRRCLNSAIINEQLAVELVSNKKGKRINPKPLNFLSFYDKFFAAAPPGYKGFALQNAFPLPPLINN
ncbi:MAG: hypothetical protein LBK66_05940 [Spirochaetaceae bacterium]|jgi:hypothetical protein|nr:hypothetical protein [Spirochaetaceae bacterium]